MSFTPDAPGRWAFEISETEAGAMPRLRTYLQGEFIGYMGRHVVVHTLREGEEIAIVGAAWENETFTISLRAYPD